MKISSNEDVVSGKADTISSKEGGHYHAHRQMGPASGHDRYSSSSKEDVISSKGDKISCEADKISSKVDANSHISVVKRT